jgi:hypothetical protein
MEDGTLAVHRLIQDAVMEMLSSEAKTKYFNYAILLLSHGIPNTLGTVTNHQFKAWPEYKRCVPHVNFLMAQTKRYSLHATDSEKFAELILRCCW